MAGNCKNGKRAADLFTQGFVSEHTILAAVLLKYLIFLLQPPKLAPAGLPAPSSCGRFNAAQASSAHPTPFAGLAARNQLPPYYAKKMIPPTDIWGAPVGRLTYGPTTLTRMQGLST